jgi:hypothetical protein
VKAGSLGAALEHEAQDYDKAVTRLRELVDEGVVPAPYDVELYDLARALRNAAELVRSLRSIVAERTPDEIHHAFGAPGDWGYGTLVGAALARLYRGEGDGQ